MSVAIWNKINAVLYFYKDHLATYIYIYIYIYIEDHRATILEKNKKYQVQQFDRTEGTMQHDIHIDH